MSDFSNRVNEISISGIREVFEAAGEDAINLGLGQPDFAAPEHAQEAAASAITAGKADGYTQNSGMESLREAIVDKYAQDQNLSITPENTIATAGGSEALHIFFQAHVNPGDEVLVPDPGFVSYAALTKLAGGTPVPVPLRDDLTLSPQAVESAISPDTVAFVLNSPGNPTGAVSSRADIEDFAAIAESHDLVCLSDEVYEYTVFDGSFHSPTEFTELENVVVINSTSKLFSMTGWRLGWVLASTDRIEKMLRVHQYAQACAAAPSQYAAEAALRGSRDIVNEMTTTFQTRRDIVVSRLREIGMEVPTPKGAFYCMPVVPDGFVDACIDRGVIVVPGEAFGAEGAGSARISYATDTGQLTTALDIMADAYEAVT
ncbi:MAG: aspartate/tyrosine/aromatic aminotransferase [Haloquadratum sp. J07HQX50]|jgi:Aspartate/tyrosine/aromatic aminotransferase|nr:MAG: aspartate/tyrosine/aromatic aminotransferase [Haloquadratum sp. J07HQX50]